MSTLLSWKKKALLTGNGAWFFPYGLTNDNCLAAYQFVGKDVTSWNIAKYDLSEHGRHAISEGSFVWSQTNGFTGGRIRVPFDPRLIHSFVIKYKNNGGGHIISTEEGGWDLWFSGRITKPEGGDLINSNTPFFWSYHYWVDWAQADAVGLYQFGTSVPTNGVVGITGLDALYINGESAGGSGVVESRTTRFSDMWNGTHVNLGVNNYSNFLIHPQANIEVIAFYSSYLTAEHHYEINANLLNIE